MEEDRAAPLKTPDSPKDMTTLKKFKRTYKGGSIIKYVSNRRLGCVWKIRVMLAS